jgi:hypothetical protein
MFTKLAFGILIFVKIWIWLCMNPVITRRQSQRIKNRMANMELKKEEQQIFPAELDSS